jgi:hypothetical protein
MACYEPMSIGVSKHIVLQLDSYGQMKTSPPNVKADQSAEANGAADTRLWELRRLRVIPLYGSRMSQQS